MTFRDVLVLGIVLEDVEREYSSRRYRGDMDIFLKLPNNHSCDFPLGGGSLCFAGYEGILIRSIHLLPTPMPCRFA